MASTFLIFRSLDKKEKIVYTGETGLEKLIGGAGLSWRRNKMDEPVLSKRCQFIRAKLALIYKQLVILDPDDVDAYVHLGEACYGLERYDEAIAAFTKAIRLNSEDSLAHYNLAKAYLKMGNGDSASQEYKILKTLNGALAEELADCIPKTSNIL